MILLTVFQVLILVSNYSAIATNIKWTPGAVRPSESDAHNAPRSQKYWDEHGIERPDYAKTDQEIALERQAKDPAKRKLSWPYAFFILAAAVYVWIRQADALNNRPYGAYNLSSKSSFADFVSRVVSTLGVKSKGDTLGRGDRMTTSHTADSLSSSMHENNNSEKLHSPDDDPIRRARLERFEAAQRRLASLKEQEEGKEQ